MRSRGSSRFRPAIFLLPAMAVAVALWRFAQWHEPIEPAAIPPSELALSVGRPVPDATRTKTGFGRVPITTSPCRKRAKGRCSEISMTANSARTAWSPASSARTDDSSCAPTDRMASSPTSRSSTPSASPRSNNTWSSFRAAPGPFHRLGQLAQRTGWPALVPSLSERAH